MSIRVMNEEQISQTKERTDGTSSPDSPPAASAPIAQLPDTPIHVDAVIESLPETPATLAPDPEVVPESFEPIMEHSQTGPDSPPTSPPPQTTEVQAPVPLLATDPESIQETEPPPPPEPAPPPPSPQPEAQESQTRIATPGGSGNEETIERIREPDEAEKEAMFRSRLKSLSPRAINVRRTRRQANYDKIIAYLKEHGYIANNDVEKLCGVRDAAATQYLRELVRQGLILKLGRGRGSRYRLVQSTL